MGEVSAEQIKDFMASNLWRVWRKEMLETIEHERSLLEVEQDVDQIRSIQGSLYARRQLLEWPEQTLKQLEEEVQDAPGQQ